MGLNGFVSRFYAQRSYFCARSSILDRFGREVGKSLNLHRIGMLTQGGPLDQPTDPPTEVLFFLKDQILKRNSEQNGGSGVLSSLAAS